MNFKILFVVLILLVVQKLQAQYGDDLYTFVFLNTNPERVEIPQDQVDSLQAGHMANINRLIKDRKMIAAGPYYTGGGIFIFDTNLEDTQAMLETDPAIAADRFKLEIYPFDMMEGEICTLWDKDEADVEMTTYQFVRFESNMDAENIVAAKTHRFTQGLLEDIQRKQKGVEVLGALNFAGNLGQVVIYKSDNEEGYESLFAEHPLVKRGLMKLQHKKLYFVKGLFCEE